MLLYITLLLGVSVNIALRDEFGDELQKGVGNARKLAKPYHDYRRSFSYRDIPSNSYNPDGSAQMNLKTYCFVNIRESLCQ